MPSSTNLTVETGAAPSAGSKWSLKDKLMGAILPSPTNTVETTTADFFLSQEDYLAKYDAISECLRGGSDDRVDLWLLRELALSPGGLLEPSLRKRAWPLLTACFQSQQDGGTGAPGSAVGATPSPNDLAALHRDVQYTVWNVREHFAQQQQLRQQSNSNDTVRVTFAPEVEEEKKQERCDECTTEEGDISFPDSVDSLWSRGSCSLAGSRRVFWRKASKMEQKIVTNAVTSCLRTAAPESEAFEDDRFHYFTGLHDLTALLMVNLESPSLSSLVL